MQPLSTLDFVWMLRGDPGREYYGLFCTVCVRSLVDGARVIVSESRMFKTGQVDVYMATGIADPMCQHCRRKGYPTPPRGGPRLN